MNILRLTPHFYYPKKTGAKWSIRRDPIGGMQTQIYRLANEMSKRNVKQTILTIGMKGVDPRLEINGYSVISSNLFIIPIPSRIRGTLGLNFYWGIGTIFKVIGIMFKELKFKTEEKYDFIHAHCSGVIAPLLVGYISKLILRKKLVYTIHCGRVTTYQPMSRFDKLINGLVIKIEKFCIKNADVIYVISPKTKSFFKKNIENIDHKLILISDMICFSEFQSYASQEKINEFKSKYKVPSNKKVITYIGRIAHEKGFEYFIKSAKNLKNDNHFLICGDGNEYSKLKDMIKLYKIESKCTLTGFISNKEVACALSITDILIIPSLHEEFGSLLLEAAAIGTTVIASNVGGLSEKINHMHNGILVNPKDSQDIIEKVMLLEKDNELKTKLGENLNKELSDKYEVSFVCEKMISDINEYIINNQFDYHKI